MSRLPSLALILVLVSSGAPAPASQADDVPPLRRLCIDAPAIVLATPTDPITPVRFRVEAVLRGENLKIGDTIAPQGIDPALARSFDEPEPTGKPRPHRVARALLFLKTSDKGKTWQLEPTGFRFCTEEGRLLVPVDR